MVKYRKVMGAELNVETVIQKHYEREKSISGGRGCSSFNDHLCNLWAVKKRLFILTLLIMEKLKKNLSNNRIGEITTFLFVFGSIE